MSRSQEGLAALGCGDSLRPYQEPMHGYEFVRKIVREIAISFTDLGKKKVDRKISKTNCQETRYSKVPSLNPP